MNCTFKELQLQNGEVIQLTLNFRRLLQLKNKRKKLYERYNLIYNKTIKDNTFDTITILYVAYLCANIDEIDNDKVMSEDEFMEEIPQSFVLINNIVTELTQPKSKKNLEKPLENQPKEKIIVK